MASLLLAFLYCLSASTTREAHEGVITLGPLFAPDTLGVTFSSPAMLPCAGDVLEFQGVAGNWVGPGEPHAVDSCQVWYLV